MAKQSGLGDRLYVGGFDLSGDVGSLGAIGGGNEPLEVTGINASAKERLGGKRDGRIEFNSWWNPAAGQEHDVLSALPTVDVGVTYGRGAVVGAQAAFLVAKQVNYDLTRGEDGALEASIQALANGFGLEWGLQYTAGAIDLAGSTLHEGASIDNGAASADGMTLFVHVGAHVTALVSIQIQQSSDDGVGDPWANVTGAQASLTGSGGPHTQRITVAGAVERYTRLQVSGSWTSIDNLQVSAARRSTPTVF